MDEASLIPYRATDLSAARILVLAAHPDDEVLGAGGTLALNAAGAEAIHVWIATDGTRQEGSEAAEDYGERRREESRKAAGILGLEPPVFGSLPDRELSARAGDLAAALNSLIAEFRPDLVFCPSPAEVHPDHRALAEALYEKLAASRPDDPDHDQFRFLRLAFYEISHPLLPDTLVDISSVSRVKEEALASYASQQAVRDYARAIGGLNTYRRLTLEGEGPAEAFRVVNYTEASTRSLEEFRRSIGPAVFQAGERGAAPVSVVVRTRNRPALVKEALESLREQTARPAQVVLVNDGGASVAGLEAAFRDAFDVVLAELPERRGRSHAANHGVSLASQALVAFLDDDDLCYPDHLERLTRAHRSGPEPVVYSDAVTVVYERREEAWEPLHRALQYSLDFDPDYLLLANYIPLHTLLLPRALFAGARGFDETLEYSEDWDLLIRLSFETAFRHLRAVTCEYRVFQGPDGDPFHVPAGQAAFQRARAEIYARYASRRTEEGLARAFDRLRAQVAFCSERDGISQGELRYQRDSHRRLNAALARAEQNAAQLIARLSATQQRGQELERESAALESRVRELEKLFASNEGYHRQIGETQTEIRRLNGILSQIYASRTWKLHLFLDRVRGRSS